jgi:hypothetical protein
MALPLMAADAAVAGKNLVTGSRTEMPSTGFERWLDARTVAPSGLGKGAEAVSSMVLGGAVAPGGAARGVETALTRAGPAVQRAERAAQEYIERNTSLKWDELAPRIKSALTEIAKDAKRLTGLNPQAIERQARLQGLKLPATRGQATRDLSQITREENLTKSNAGGAIRDINAEQDRILHQHLDTLRGQTGAKAQTRTGVGESVQGAQRAKLLAARAAKTQAYKEAEQKGAGRAPADTQELEEWLKKPTNARNAPYLRKAIDDYLPKNEHGAPKRGGPISINDLEEIRKEASANVRKPGPEGFFAKQAVKVIDAILDRSGGDEYKRARAANAALKDEFERQGRIRKLVSEKGYTKDRAVALEDTFDHFIRGSAEDISRIKASLLDAKGGTEKTRAMGQQAWRDLQGATVDYLKNAAAGKRSIVGERGQLQFNSSFREAFSELDKDGKIDQIFSPEQAKLLRQIYEAVGDIRTKPTGRIAGSDTTPRLINMLERFGKLIEKVPGAGPLVGGAARKVGELYEKGTQARQVAEAARTPLEEAVASKRPILKLPGARTATAGTIGAVLGDREIAE